MSLLYLKYVMEQFNNGPGYVNIEAVSALTICACLIVLFYILGFSPNSVNNRALIKYGLLKFFYSNIFKTFIPSQFNRYCHAFFVVFIAIFSINIYGLFTYCFTLTGCLLFTATTSFTFMFWTFISFICRLDKNFLASLAPIGLPGYLSKCLIFIELLSYIGRFISLTARLFINVLSGHLLAKIISTTHKAFFWSFLSYGHPNTYYLVIILISLLTISVAILEVFVAVLQAYIFVFLLSLYINEAF